MGDRESFLAFLKETNKKFVDAYAARDASQLNQIFAEDARIMPPNRPMMGPANVEEFVKLIVSRGHHRLVLETQEVFGPFGDVAIERAIVQFYTAENKKKYDIKALITWRKINGQWRIQADCWNFDHPEPLA